jgi:hypothetical protein
MPTPTYIALATTTLTAAANSVTFSSIPTTVNGVALRDLILIGHGRSNRNNLADLYVIRFNGSNTNYPRVVAYGNGSIRESFSDATLNEIRPYALSAATAGAGIFGFMKMQIMDYSQTNKEKTVLINEDAAAGNDVAMSAYRWTNTAAINQISVAPLLGTQLAIGTTLSLYGIAG